MKTTVPMGSVWKAKDGRMFRVIQKKPFGIVDLMQVDRAYFMDVEMAWLKSNMVREDSHEPLL